jgi:hypothetical protein
VHQVGTKGPPSIISSIISNGDKEKLTFAINGLDTPETIPLITSIVATTEWAPKAEVANGVSNISPHLASHRIAIQFQIVLFPRLKT